MIESSPLSRTIAKLGESDCFEAFKKLNARIVKYLIAEWNEKPTDYEINKVIAQFYGEHTEHNQKLFNVIHDKDEILALAGISLAFSMAIMDSVFK